MAEEVKLFAAIASPYCCRVDIALKLKGVQYEYVVEKTANKSPELLKYNPVHKKIPVLLHNGKPVAESLVIVEYIDEAWNGGYHILPEDAYSKAMARFWAKFIDEKCVPAIGSVFVKKGEEQEKAIEEANGLLNILENELKGKKFFGGDTIGLADIAGDFIAYWVGIFEEVTGLELLTKEKYPKLNEWINEFLGHHIVKETLPPRDGLVGFFRARFGKA